MKKYKVKIKVGHLCMILISIFILFPFILYSIASCLINTRNERYYNKKSYYGTAIMELYSKVPKVTSNNGKTYYDIATGYYNILEDNIYKASFGMFNGFIGDEKRVNKAIENYKRGVSKGEEDEYYCKNLSMLINTLAILNNTKEAMDYINHAINSDNIDVRRVGLINKVIILAKNYKTDEALELCKENFDDDNFQVLYLNILYNYKNAEIYNEEYRRVFGANDNFKNSSLDYDEKNLEPLKYIDFKCQTTFTIRDGGDKKISGRIIKNGKGVPCQRIALGVEDVYNLNRYYSNLSDEAIQRVYTDENGYYEFIGVSKGEHDVTLTIQGYLLQNAQLNEIKEDINNERVHNVTTTKVGDEDVVVDYEILEYMDINKEVLDISKEWLTINLPKVKNAKYIDVSCGNAGVVSYKSIINGDWKVRLPLSNGCFLMKNFALGDDGGDFGFGYLGTIKKTDIYIYLTYKDEAGRVLAQTPYDALRYKNPEKILNEGDKLLKKGKLEEGIKWYQEEIEKGNCSREFLYPIIRYYGDWDYINLDKEESIKKYNEYYDKLKDIGIEDVEKNWFDSWRSNWDD